MPKRSWAAFAAVKGQTSLTLYWPNLPARHRAANVLPGVTSDPVDRGGTDPVHAPAGDRDREASGPSPGLGHREDPLSVHAPTGDRDREASDPGSWSP